MKPLPFPVSFYGRLLPEDGYGHAVLLNIASLLATGTEVRVHPQHRWDPAVVEEPIRSLALADTPPAPWGIFMQWPPSVYEGSGSRYTFGFTMLEGTRAPDW